MASSYTSVCSLLLRVRILFVKRCEVLARMTINLNAFIVAHPLCRETGPNDQGTAPSEHVLDKADCVLTDKEVLNVNTP